jgi:hypothetical protein
MRSLPPVCPLPPSLAERPICGLWWPMCKVSGLEDRTGPCTHLRPSAFPVLTHSDGPGLAICLLVAPSLPLFVWPTFRLRRPLFPTGSYASKIRPLGCLPGLGRPEQAWPRPPVYHWYCACPLQSVSKPGLPSAFFLWPNKAIISSEPCRHGGLCPWPRKVQVYNHF